MTTTTDTPTTTEIDISSAAATEIVTAKEIDEATEALVNEFVEEDELTELELANQRLIEEHNIVEVIDCQIGLDEYQANRLARICRDRGIDAQGWVAAIVGAHLEYGVGAPTISRPNLNTTEVETQQEPVIQKITGVSEKRQIVSFVSGQERR
jgi:hypothetical protein